MPDVLGRDRASYENRRILVVGAGRSAANVLVDLARLADGAPETEFSWAVRRGTPTRLFGGGDADQLSARGALGKAVRDLVNSGRVTLHMDIRVVAIRNTVSRPTMVARDSQVFGPFDISSSPPLDAAGRSLDHA